MLLGSEIAYVYSASTRVHASHIVSTVLAMPVVRSCTVRAQLFLHLSRPQGVLEGGAVNVSLRASRKRVSCQVK